VTVYYVSRSDLRIKSRLASPRAGSAHEDVMRHRAPTICECRTKVPHVRCHSALFDN
jgi:hypothetical protein